MRAAETAAAPARLLPSGDAYFLLDGAERELLVPREDQRQRLWTSRVWPGALLVEGEIRGTWRRAQHTVRIDAWARLSRGTRDAIEAEASALPLPGVDRRDRGGLEHVRPSFDDVRGQLAPTSGSVGDTRRTWGSSREGSKGDAGRGPPDRVPPGPVPDRRLPGALGRADAAHAARGVDVHDRRRGASRCAGRGTSSRRCRARTITIDIHCVTKWSKLDTVWEGVSVDTLLEARRARRRRTSLAFCDGGYTTNLPLEDVTGGKAWVAYGYDGEPLDPSTAARRGCSSRTSTSGRARSGCAASTLRDEDEPGFWESNGYHLRRRSVAGTAVLGRLTLARRGGGRGRWRRRRASGRSSSTCRGWPGHRAGQHLDVRLTAEDGYQAERSYSIASAPGERARAHGRAARRRRGLAVPRRTRCARATARGARADRRLLRLGRRRARAAAARGGGSGVVPLMAMVAPPRARGLDAPMRLLYSSRTLEDVIYRDELDDARATARRRAHAHA